MDQLERFARNSKECFGCGKEKDDDLILCWNCFKYRGINSFKYYKGSFKVWLIKYGVRS